MPGLQPPSSSSSRIRARPPPSSPQRRGTIVTSNNANANANNNAAPSTPSSRHHPPVPLESVVIRNDSLSTPLKSPRAGSSSNSNNNSSSSSNNATNVQVCVRLRPMLASDFKHLDAAAAKNPASAILPSSNNGSGSGNGNGATPAKKGSAKGFARETASSFRHHTESKKNVTPRKSGMQGPSNMRKHTSGLQTPVSPSNNNAANANANAAANKSTKQQQRQAEKQAYELEQKILHYQPSWSTHHHRDGENNDANKKRITQAAHTTQHTQHRDAERLADYTFDRVYHAEEATGTLYEESIRGVVRSVVEGFHGSVFAYGQTSSGKTHTMTGSPNEAGVVRLAVQDVFHRIRSQQSHTNSPREYLVRVSYLEIYNEQIYDLLAPQQAQMKGSLQHHHLPPSTAVRIFESRTEGVVIRGLKEEIVTGPEDVFALLDSGDAKRKVGSTGMNKTSSRSHSVFRLVLESRASAFTRSGGGVPPLVPSSNSSLNSDADSVATGRSSVTGAAKGPVRISSLSLVDLAGSESAKATGSTGVRQKEGQYINKSLLTLGHVVCKLSEISEREGKNGSGAGAMASKEHIPYRDSKLTRLLQPSLGGNAQVCIICNISPALTNLEESHNTLKFAMRAKKIKQNAKITEVKDEKTLLRSYREEIEELKRQLKEAQKAATEAQQMSQRQVAQQRPITRYDSSSDEEDQEDTHVLVSAIANLESLILKAGVGGGGGKSTRKLMNAKNDDGSIDGTADGGRDESSDLPSRALDVELRKAASEEDGDANNSSGASSPITRGLNNSVQDESADNEHNLLEELHRIQGMLGTVMKKKRTKGSKSTVSAGSNSNYNNYSQHTTPARDAEVERLRSQLQEQDVASTMRKADSSFLQNQLNEKEGILNEVSVLLEALERRQLELESENKQLRGDLGKAANMIEDGDAKRKALEEQLQEKDVQLEEKKDVVFVEHGTNE